MLQRLVLIASEADTSSVTPTGGWHRLLQETNMYKAFRELPWAKAKTIYFAEEVYPEALDHNRATSWFGFTSPRLRYP